MVDLGTNVCKSVRSLQPAAAVVVVDIGIAVAQVTSASGELVAMVRRCVRDACKSVCYVDASGLTISVAPPMAASAMLEQPVVLETVKLHAAVDSSEHNKSLAHVVENSDFHCDHQSRRSHSIAVMVMAMFCVALNACKLAHFRREPI